MAESLGMYYYGVGIDFSPLDQGIKQAVSVIRASGAQMKQSLKDSMTGASDAIKSIDSSFKLANKSAAESAQVFEQEMKKLEKSSKKSAEEMNQAYKKVGDRLVMVATAAAVALGAAAAKFADFDTLMARVGAKSDATAEELEALRKQAEYLAISEEALGFSSKEIAGAMEFLAQMGLKPIQIFQAMPGILAAAAASTEDVGLVAETTANTLNSFEMAATESAHVADVFAMAANKSAADLTNLSYALKYAGPVAHQLRYSFEEVAAAIMIMSDAGIKGEMGGTALRAGMLRLVSPAREGKQVMEALGLQFKTANGELKPLSGIVGELQTKMAGLTNAQKAQALSMLFGERAVAGMMVLINSGAGKIDDYTEALQNCDGEAKRVAKAIKDNLGGDLKALNTTFTTTVVILIRDLAPALRAVAQAITAVIKAFADMPEWLRKIIAYGASFAIIWTLVAGLFLTIRARILLAGSSIHYMAEALKVLFVPLNFLVKSLGTLIIALFKTAGAWLVGLGPVGWVIAILIALGAAVALFIKAWNTNFLGFRDATKQLLEGLTKAWTNFLNFFKNIGLGIYNIIKGIIQVQSNPFDPDKGFASIKQGFNNLKDAASNYANVFKGLGEGVLNYGTTIGGNMVDGIKEAWKNGKSQLSGMFTTPASNLTTAPDSETLGLGNPNLDGLGGDQESPYEAAKRAYEEEIAGAELLAEEKMAIYKKHLENVKKTEKEITDYKKGLGDLELAAKREQKALEKALFEKQVADEKVTTEDAFRRRIQFLQEDVQSYKDGTVEKVNAEKAVIEAQKEYQRWKQDLNSLIEDNERSHQESLLGIEEDNINFRKEINAISEEESLTLLQDVENKRYEIQRSGLEKKAELVKNDAVKYQDIMNEIQELDDKNTQEQAANAKRVMAARILAAREVKQLLLEQEKSHKESLLDIEADYNNDLQRMGLITEKEAIQREMAIEEQKYEIQRRALEQRAELLKNDPANYQEVLNQIAEMQDQHNQKMVGMARDLAMEQKSVWTGLIDNMKSVFRQGFDAIREGTITWQGAINAIFDNIFGYFADLAAEWVTNWLKKMITKRTLTATQNGIEKGVELTQETAKQTALTGIVSAGEMMRAAIVNTTNLALLASGKASALSMVTANAAAYMGLLGMIGSIAAAIATIYPVGPAMAAAIYAGIGVATGTLTAATAAATAGIMAFDVGTMSVPQDMLAQVHKGEVIIPAPFSDAARQMLSGEGGGGGETFAPRITYVTKTHDTRGVRRELKKNGNTIASILETKYRDFKLTKKW